MFNTDIKNLILSYLPIKIVTNVYCTTTLCLSNQIWPLLANRFGFTASNSQQFKEKFAAIERQERNKVNDKYDDSINQLKLEHQQQLDNLKHQQELELEQLEDAKRDQISKMYTSFHLRHCHFAEGWYSRKLPAMTMLIQCPALLDPDITRQAEFNRLVKKFIISLFGYYPTGKYPPRSELDGLIELTFCDKVIWLECKDKIKNSKYKYILGSD